MLISIVIFPTSQPITTCSASKWTVSLVQKGFTVKPWRLQQYLQSQKRQVSGMKRVGGLDCFAVFPLQPKWCFLHFGERDTILKEVKKLDMCVSNNPSRCQSWNGQKKVSVWSFFKHHFKRSTCNHDPTLVMEGWIDSIDGPQVQGFSASNLQNAPKNGCFQWEIKPGAYPSATPAPSAPPAPAVPAAAVPKAAPAHPKAEMTKKW